ncbi:Dynactin subunit 2, partial [Nowakowskiella sp. JEL0078]
MDKYHTLPDIDNNGLDVYETPDPAPRLSNPPSPTETNDAINITSIDAHSTTLKFASLLLEPSPSVPQLKRRPFPRSTADYALTRSTPLETETVIERYHRLASEVDELKAMLGPPATPGDPGWLVDKVSLLQHDLEGLGVSAGVGVGVLKDAGVASRQIGEFSRLMDSLREVRGGEAGEEGVVYEVYMSGELARVGGLAKVGELEGRIAALEKLIGTYFVEGLDHGDDAVADIIQTSGSLIAALNTLDQYLTVLTQPTKLDFLTAKVKTLTAQLEKLAELRKRHVEQPIGSSNGLDFLRQNGELDMQTIQSETERRVEFLFNTLEKLEPVANSIPQLITRLRALRQLHSEAAVFSDTLHQLREDQSKTDLNCQQLLQAVSRMEQSFEANKEL